VTLAKHKPADMAGRTNKSTGKSFDDSTACKVKVEVKYEVLRSIQRVFTA